MLTQPYFFIRHDGRNQRIRMAEISHLEARKNYVRIVTLTGDYLALSTLRQLLKLLPPDQFVQIHRGIIVNLEAVESFDRTLVYTKNENLPIGPAYASVLLSRIVLLNGPATQTPGSTETPSPP